MHYRVEPKRLYLETYLVTFNMNAAKHNEQALVELSAQEFGIGVSA